MDDSISEFARNLIAKAKAREELLLKRQGNYPTTMMMGEAATFMENKPIPVGEEEEEEGQGKMANKENFEESEFMAEEGEDEMDMEEDGDEGVEEEGDQCETEDGDRVLPLVSKPLSKVIASSLTQSASPISRKSRLSALAQTINAWEDDLATPVKKGPAASGHSGPGPSKPSTPKTPRFSVSTPPQANRLANPNRASSCHQFVSTPGSGGGGLSPTKRVQVQKESNDSIRSSNASLNDSSMIESPLPSPQKNLQSEVVRRNTPTSSPLCSPQKRAVLAASYSSPKKNVSFSMDVEDASSPAELRGSPSPIKGIGNNAVDSAVKSLELQGFVKVDKTAVDYQDKESVVPGKIASSILNKKRMFEKDGEMSSVPPAPKVSKITSTSVSVQPQRVPVPITVAAPAIPNESSTRVQQLTQQYNSRKSLQPDPSELSVAQKAKLFEKQQKEQEQLRYKELEVNRRLQVGKLKTFAVGSDTKSVGEEKKSLFQDKSHEYADSKTVPSSSDKPQYYFGENESMIPPPPPLPQQFNKSPVKRPDSVKPKPIQSDSEQSDEEENEKHTKNGQNRSPDLIAKSVKPIKLVQKADKMYPSLTDIENTETEDNETNTSSVGDSRDASFTSTSSLGSYIANKAQCTTASELNTTLAIQQIDDLIDEALEGQLVEDTFTDAVPLSTSSPIVPKSFSQPQPLMHTVSMYRKRQQQMKKVENDEETFKMPQKLLAVEEEDEEQKEAVKEKVQILEQQVAIQQKSIAQASKALNICESTFEFNNSTENVEGERVLLIATQKRSQLLSHISRLRNNGKDDKEAVISPSKDVYRPSPAIKGTMRIDNIQLYPIKSTRLHQDYVYHFIVLLKYNEHVYATGTVKTSASNLTIDFPNEFVIQEMEPGFKVQIEVYALRTFKQIDVIPHHMKYHIKTPTSGHSSASSTPNKTSTLSHFLTPTKGSKQGPKATDLRTTPASSNMQSTNSIRTSNFTLQAVLNLNLCNLNKTEWEMSMVNSNLILPNVSMRVKCNTKNELNYKGFLTGFSDVSGLGAWHRRWALLDENYHLLFWTYPEDEGQKPPVLRVELSSCITPRITPTPRDVCARPHTFILVTTRDPLPTDQESLVMSVNEKYTAIKHIFSADNRTERDEWIGVINKALTNMRAWGICKEFNE